MPTISPNNPAARLYLILKEAKTKNAQATIGDVWAAVLDTPRGGNLWSRVSLVHGLPREIKKQLQLRPEYDPHELSWWEPLSAALTNYGAREQWTYIKREISEDILGRIRVNAKTLSRIARETVLDRSIIDELQSNIRTIQERMADETELDDDIADFLNQRLEYMDDLLGDIPIVGAVGIKLGMKKAVAEIEEVSEELKSALTPTMWDRFELILGRVQTVFKTVTVVSASIVSTTAAYSALIPATPQLEHTQPQPEEQASRELPSPPQEPERQGAGDQNDPLDADFKEVQDKGKDGGGS